MIERAEKQYIDGLRHIYNDGTDLKNPRTGEICRTIINIDLTYDGSTNKAPILTTRKIVNPYLPIAELLGYIKGVTSAAQMRELGTKSWDCVPLTTKILTKRGYLNYNEVEIGDETIGFNSQTGLSEWTKITAINQYEEAFVFRMYNSRYHVDCTLNHKWLVEKRHYLGINPVTYELKETFNLSNSSTFSSIILSKPTDTGKGLDITLEEASLLGWIAGDGWVEKYKDTPRGRKRPSIGIAQVKSEYITILDQLLSNFEHSRYEKDNKNKNSKHLKHIIYRLTPDYSDDLKKRVGHPKDNVFNIVLNMSSEQRKLWLEAIRLAEGNDDTIYQTVGPILEAIKLAIYLEGYRPSECLLIGKEQWTDCYGLGTCRPYFSRSNRILKQLDDQPVWCPTTKLGTWTANQNGFIFLTGNSNANENKSWLANPNREGDDDLGLIYGAVAKNWPVINNDPNPSPSIDLFHKVYNNLKNGIDDRGEIITFWNPGMFHLGCLRPCMYEHQFSLLGDDLYLNSTQRSNDFPLGMTANMVQVWLFLRLMAQITNKNPKQAFHRSVNSHIYGPQLKFVPTQLDRELLTEPTIDINPDIKTLEDLETWVSIKDFKIDYTEYHPPIKYPFTV